MTNSKQNTEIIAIASGKGGTGKTLIASCLGYSLIRGGQSVLMIDGDPATDGLSLFLLGPKGATANQLRAFEPSNTFTGILTAFKRTGTLNFEARDIHRIGNNDHGVSYHAIISGRGLYGDDDMHTGSPAVPDLDQSSFRAGVRMLFDALRASNQFSYVLVDTRGGFAFESTDVCALADSFIVVTEPDYTSFYQDRNLVRRINRAAQELNATSVLRAFIVNKSTEGEQQGTHLDLSKLERSFRLEITKEFPVKFEDTHPIPVDIEALIAYKTQQIPYVSAPSSLFSFATITAVGDILQVVTSRWSHEQVEEWNQLVGKISQAVEEKNSRVQHAEQERLNREKEITELRSKSEALQVQVEHLQAEMSRMEKAYERELARSEAFLSARRVVSDEEGGLSREERLESEWKARRRKSRWLLAPGLIILALGILLLLGYREWRTARANDLLAKAYDVSVPGVLRADFINELVNSYGRRKLDGINLKNSTLSGLRLENVSLRSATLDDSDLSNVNLSHCDLSLASFVRADLSGSILVGANLSSALLNDADLRNSDLRGAFLKGPHYLARTLKVHA